MALAACMAVEDPLARLQTNVLVPLAKTRHATFLLVLSEERKRSECRPLPEDVLSWRADLEREADQEFSGRSQISCCNSQRGCLQDVLAPEAWQRRDPAFTVSTECAAVARQSSLCQATLWADVSGVFLGFCAAGLSTLLLV